MDLKLKELRVKKSCIHFHTSKNNFMKKLIFLAMMILWMYTAAVRLVLTYCFTLLWPAQCKKCNRTKLGKIQKTMYAGLLVL